MKKTLILFVSYFCMIGLWTSCSSSNEYKTSKGGEELSVMHSDCLNTRADDDEDYIGQQTMVFTKEGSTVYCEWLEFWANCFTFRFIVKPELNTASDGMDSLSIFAYGAREEFRLHCQCPYNIYFVVNDVKTDELHVKCDNWVFHFDGVVSFKEQDRVEIVMEREF